MRKISILFAVICLMIIAACLPVSAAADEIFSMDIVLSDDRRDWNNENVIFVTDDEEMTYEYATVSKCGVVISFRMVGESLRIGMREPTCAGLQVRKEIPLLNIQDNQLHITLRYSEGKYMLYVDETAVNDRNWNTICPEGMTEEKWKTTDNIALCTDYSRLPGGGMEHEDGEMAFLMQDISGRQLYVLADEYAGFRIENLIYGYSHGESADVRTDSSENTNSSKTAGNNSGRNSVIWYIAGGALLLVVVAVGVFFISKKRARTGSQGKENE